MSILIETISPEWNIIVNTFTQVFWDFVKFLSVSLWSLLFCDFQIIIYN